MTENGENGIRRYGMAETAYRDVELYCRLARLHQIDVECFDWERKWEELPVITKGMISGRLADLLAPRYIFWENTPKMQSLFTSGTTGVCLEISWLLADMKMSLMPLWLRRAKEYGVLPGDRFCTFYSLRHYTGEENWYQISSNELAFAKEGLNEERLYDIYGMLVEERVKWMIVQPTILYLLYQFVVKNNLPVWKELAYIELTGECVQSNFYRKIREWFGVPVLNQYGTYEVNTIAYGESTDYLDVVSSNVYVEIVDEKGKVLPDGTEGDVCVTCLTNHAMPFIRYLVGDRGKMRDFLTAKGEKKRQICLTQARCADLIRLKNGTEINPYVLQKGVVITNQIMDDAVIQFRFIQIAYDVIIVELVTSGGSFSFNQICKCIRDHIFQKELQEIQFRFEKKEYLMFDPGKEKRGWFYSML